MECSSAASVSQSSNSSQPVLKRKSNDVGWEYAILVDANNLDRVQCIKCGKTMSVGVYRIKEHIAHIMGNVSSCMKASKEDQAICKNGINEGKLKKKKKKNEDESLRSEVNIPKSIDEVNVDQLQESLGSMKSPYTLGPMDKFANVINPEASLGSGKSKREQSINETLFKERTDKVKAYVCRWVYEAGVSFNCIELDSFKLMMEAVGQFGPGFKPPTRYEMSEPFLKKEIDRTKGLLKTHEEVGDAMGEDGSPRPRRSSRIRELYEDDFESEDVEEINENEVEFGSDEELVLEVHGERE